ncbi:MAG TPA: hypothetical protein VHW60_15845 [Caulobacteraceae bacterium]|jgi:hypothetical protein|nr:hypothetical protein [Caulobacteraceae bacterium]
MDDLVRAADLRARAARLRDQAVKFADRAESLPPGTMADMLIGEAKILLETAGALETQALALMPPLGTA